MVIKLRRSYWLDNYNKTKIPKKELPRRTDILIIGGGITGISTAYMLKDLDQKITILDANEVGSGVTAYTTAKVSILHDTLYSDLTKYHGKEKTFLYLESQKEAAELIEKIIKKERIACNYKKEDAYIYATTDEEFFKLKKEWEILKELDDEVELVDQSPLPIKIKKAIRYKNNAVFHPLKYLNNLVKILLKKGIDIHEQARVVNIDDNETYYEVELETGEKICSEILIVATHYPIKKFSGLYFTKLLQERSYAVAFKTSKAIKGMYINIDNPIRSYRNINKKTMIVGGGSHCAGDEVKVNYYQELKETALEYDEKAKILNESSTEDCMSVDQLPFIGQYSLFSPKCYVATGFGKWGMTNSHVAALSIMRDIKGMDNPYQELYNPTRFSQIKALPNFISFLGKITNGLILSKLRYPRDEYSTIPIDSGKVIKEKTGAVAIYRKSKDEFIRFKPNCTHLGCSILWNELDKTWDCKCHGSRFSPEGNVLNEPACKPLDKI